MASRQPATRQASSPNARMITGGGTACSSAVSAAIQSDTEWLMARVTPESASVSQSSASSHQTSSGMRGTDQFMARRPPRRPGAADASGHR